MGSWAAGEHYQSYVRLAGAGCYHARNQGPWGMVLTANMALASDCVKSYTYRPAHACSHASCGACNGIWHQRHAFVTPLTSSFLLYVLCVSCRWHAAGRQLLKHHSVTDLLAVLQHLIETGVTAPGLIAGHAASAGGLTLAAAINQRPDWFSAAVLEAPYVDWVAGTGAVTQAGEPLVGDHMLTEHETDEWGDPWADPAVAELVCRLCPYTNLRAGVRYPDMMLTAGLQDSRVPWWMPVKYVAKLRSMQETRASTASTGGSQSSSEGGSGASDSDVNSAVGGSSAGAVGAPEVLLQFDESGSHFSMGLSGGNLQDAALQQAYLLTHIATV